MYFLLIFLKLSISMAITLPSVRCPLHWTNIDADMTLSRSHIATQTDHHYFIIGKYNNSAVTGRMAIEDGKSGIGLLIHSGNNGTQNVTEAQSYKGLYNSHGCNVSWVIPGDSRTADLAVTTPWNSLVGRTNVENEILPGEVSGAGRIVYVDLEGEIATKSENYFVLISFSKGLQLEIKNFEASEEIPTNKETLGMEKIVNHGDSAVDQTITHGSRVTETFTFTESESTTTSYSVAANVHVQGKIEIKAVTLGGGFGVGMDFQRSNTKGYEKEFSTERTKDITVSRTVSVPPRTSILACSYYHSVENAVVKYNAKAYYKSPGLNGTEVLKFVKSYFPEAWVEGNAAVTDVKGEISGSFSLTTKFIIVPLEGVKQCEHF